MGNGSGTMMAMMMMMVVAVGAFGIFYFRSNKPAEPPLESGPSIPGLGEPSYITTQPDVRITNVSYDFDCGHRDSWRNWYWPRFSKYGLFSDDFEEFLEWVIDKKRSNKDIKKWIKRRLKDRGRDRDWDRNREKDWDRDFDRDWNDDRDRWERENRDRDRFNTRDNDRRDRGTDIDRFLERRDDDRSDRRLYNAGNDYQKNEWESKRGGKYKPLGVEL